MLRKLVAKLKLIAKKQKQQLKKKRGARIGVNKGGKIVLGNGTFFNNNSLCISLGEINIGNNCAIGPNVCIYDHDHGREFNQRVRRIHTDNGQSERGRWDSDRSDIGFDHRRHDCGTVPCHEGGKSKAHRGTEG